MKKIILFLIITAIANTAYAEVLISQVYYDPINTESGGEAVELFNNGNSSKDISGYVIATESTMNDAVIPENTTICPGCYYLIADKGWNNSKDNETWPDADLEETIGLYNKDSGVALTYNGKIIDSAGWGDKQEIKEELYEGEPALEVPEGKALFRKRDTDNNKEDFYEETPSLRSSSDLGTGTDKKELKISFQISSLQENTIIKSINLTGGNKIRPLPGGIAEVEINAVLSSGSSVNATAEVMGTIIQLSKKEDLNSTYSLFSGIFGLNYSMKPGNYSINISTGSQSKKIYFEYLEKVAIEIDKTRIDMGEVDKEEESLVEIRNIGNKNLDIGIKGNLPGCYYSIEGSDYQRLSPNIEIQNLNIEPGKEKEIYFKIKTEGLKTGEYESVIEIVGLGSEN